ncbi:MAG TPA: hypothetical protein PLP95_13515, partial [Microthrixaceae bacterium]|nr:hypothetical protein [Microthrixaceae bacterium]
MDQDSEEPESNRGPDATVSDGMEHLQVAANEMIAAARVFLNVIEEVVADREKLASVAGGVTDLLSGTSEMLTRLVQAAGSTHAADPAGADGASARGRHTTEESASRRP